MPDVTVYNSNPGLAVLLSKGAQFNAILQSQQRIDFATGEGVLGLVGGVVDDQGAPQVPVELANKIDTLRTDYGGFSPYLGNGYASGYEGNLYARARGIDAPRIILQPVDLAIKDATIATGTDLLAKFDLTLSVTIEADDDVVTCDRAHGLSVGDTVQFSALDAGGAGLATGTTYYVLTVPSSTTLTLSATAGGSVLDVTTDYSTGTMGQTSRVYTLPAGTRLGDDPSSPTYTVATLEDVTWAVGESGTKTVRCREVAGTPAGLNTLTDILDTITQYPIPNVTTTETGTPDAVDAAELALRYEAAFDALLNNTAGQAITVLVCDQDVAGICNDLVDHCVTASGRGYFRVGVVSPPIGTTAAAAEGTTGDGAGRAALDGTRGIYVHPGVQRPFREDSDNLTSPDYLATVPAAVPLAARIAATRPEENPTRPHQVLRSYGIVALEALAIPATPLGHYNANIVLPEFARNNGRLSASFRDGILADGTQIADLRLRDMLAAGLIEALDDYHKAPATTDNREAAGDAASGYLQQLVDAQRIADFAVSLDWDADNDHLTVQCAVDKTGNMDVITLSLLVGGSAVASSTIEEAA